MTTVQMKHFITVATCLNYTEAANQLYISQPALSRQIISLERELNLQLFIRNKRSMRLTPAGEFLLKEIQQIYNKYLQAIEHAQMLQRGMFGELNIGILDGHRVSGSFPSIVSSLRSAHPNLSVSLFRGSFHELNTSLYNGTADLIVTLGFSVTDKQLFACCSLSSTKDHLVMLRSNPLAKKERVGISDLKHQTLIAISAEDSPVAHEGMVQLHQQAQCETPLIVAPNLETLTLWVQAGLGISILNDFNMLSLDDSLVFLPWDISEDIAAHATDLTLAWRKDNGNPALAVFLAALS